MNKKKYQIFISSTYTDLIEARSKIIENILCLNHFPIGMEMFSADDDEQWETIKETINQSDYYIIIIGHRYGSLITDGSISYTEKEYDYALSLGLPILVFIRDRNAAIKPSEQEHEPKIVAKLEAFINKAKKNKMCDFWTNIDELGTKIVIALSKIFTKKPGIGWVRADNMISPEVATEISKLSQENRSLRGELSELKSNINEKLPNINVIFNDNDDSLKIKYINLDVQRTEYPKTLVMKEVPEHLKKYINQSDIDIYNLELPDDEAVDSFNDDIITYLAIKNNSTEFVIQISNIGKCKANGLFIDIIFSQDVFVIQKDDAENLEVPKLRMPKNPIEKAKKAQKEFQKKNSISDFYSNVLIKPRNLIIPPAIELPEFIKSTPKQDYSIKVEKNKISIKIDTLMHTRKFIFNKLLIVPLRKSECVAKVNVICEEYAEPKTFELPISVVDND